MFIDIASTLYQLQERSSNPSVLLFSPHLLSGGMGESKSIILILGKNSTHFQQGIFDPVFVQSSSCIFIGSFYLSNLILG